MSIRLLLVEDEEPIRKMLCFGLESEGFEILEASTSEQAWITLNRLHNENQEMPDLILLDWMLPGASGLEFAQKLKKKEFSNNIPIIMLTARGEEDDRVKGLDAGADDYIVKPFNLDYLQVKVENLISSRKKLQQRYKQDAVLTPQDLAVTNLDQDFLQRIEDILKEQLTETSFNTEAFAKAACLSRMQLHRKLKALTGLSATEFIRSQRLKLAAHLLKQSDANVSEIGYQVGFSSPAYFSKLFKDAYGCSPSEYANRK